MLSIGTSTSGETPDLLSFGFLAGGTFAVAAILLLLVRSRVLWIAVGVLQFLVIVGYFAAADVRTPPFELWGLAIKACQVVVLLAVAYLTFRGPEAARA